MGDVAVNTKKKLSLKWTSGAPKFAYFASTRPITVIGLYSFGHLMRVSYAELKYTMRLWSLRPLRVYFLSEQDTEFESAVETAVDCY